jgi:hypothetical protein
MLRQSAGLDPLRRLRRSEMNPMTRANTIRPRTGSHQYMNAMSQAKRPLSMTIRATRTVGCAAVMPRVSSALPSRLATVKSENGPQPRREGVRL